MITSVGAGTGHILVTSPRSTTFNLKFTISVEMFTNPVDLLFEARVSTTGNPAAWPVTVPASGADIRVVSIIPMVNSLINNRPDKVYSKTFTQPVVMVAAVPVYFRLEMRQVDVAVTPTVGFGQIEMSVEVDALNDYY
jgi:hypothetical protein